MDNRGMANNPSMLSPYLNFDPSALTQSGDSQYLLPEGGMHKRGRFELAFATIGGSIFTGAFLGGVNGAYKGLRETRAQQLTGSVRYTQMLNFVLKNGASSAQTLGVIALLYSGFGVIISKTRDAEDELNTIASGTLTGLLFKSTAGVSKCLRAGAIGFGLSTAYALYSGRDRIQTFMRT